MAEFCTGPCGLPLTAEAPAQTEWEPLGWCQMCWNRQKYQAHNAYRSALRDGRIRNPKRCSIEDCPKHHEDCGKIEGHHTNYLTPLDVVWLCVNHHRKAHEARKREVAAVPSP